MRSLFRAIVAAVCAAVSLQAASLQDVCTISYAQGSLLSKDFYFGVTIDPSSVIITPVTKAIAINGNFYPDAVFDYCSVTFAYSHDGSNDEVYITYWLPTRTKFQNGYLSTGGGRYAINSENSSLPGGIIYGAVDGITDGGFWSFSTNSDQVFLIQNGTVN